MITQAMVGSLFNHFFLICLCAVVVVVVCMNAHQN